MYYGRITQELIRLRKEYLKKFGYDPNGDMEIEVGDEDYEEYVEALRESIRTCKEINKTLDGADY